MALGGYAGADAILTPEALARMVARRELRFIMIVSEDVQGQRPGRNAALIDWVRQHGRLVDTTLWRPARYQPVDSDPLGTLGQQSSRRLPRGIAALRLYDLSPADDVIAPRSD